jgi:hypothetical protein
VRDTGLAENPLSILAVTQGMWGERIAQNIAANAPSTWIVHTWAAPRVIPPIVDYPEDYLPDSFPQVELVLALGDVPGFAQLVPDIARLSGARAVLAPIDRNEALPEGLARQLAGWLQAMGVASAFPKPFCSLSVDTYNRTPLVEPLEDETLRAFARHFGRPQFKVEVEDGLIARIDVQRDAACGCGAYVAQGLIGVPVDQALEEAGLLHHHYPCLASMNKDPHYRDTLMHVSGNFLIDSLKEDLREHLNVGYIRPHGLSES